MALPLKEHEQHLMDLLMAIPPKLEDAETFLQQHTLSKESISKIGALYAEHCQFEVGDASAIPENGNRPLGNSDFPKGILSGFHSTYVYEVTKLLLDYGLDPNAIIWGSGYDYYNIMDALMYIDNEYVAADTMALLMEHGGNPNLHIDGETLYEMADFEVWYGSSDQDIRWRHDSWVHIWMVLTGYGGKINGRDDFLTRFREYDSREPFCQEELKNHRNYYYGYSYENRESVIHIYDRKTLWEVARG